MERERKERETEREIGGRGEMRERGRERARNPILELGTPNTSSFRSLRT